MGEIKKHHRLKRWVIILSVVVLIVFVLTGCPKRYPFENKGEPIESIEMLYHPYAKTWEGEDTLNTIRFLDDNEIPTFMESVYKLKTRAVIGDPPSGWGVYIARVTYENGDVEYLGSTHIEFVENGSEPCSVGFYYFPGDSFDKLFLKYAWDLDIPENN